MELFIKSERNVITADLKSRKSTELNNVSHHPDAPDLQTEPRILIFSQRNLSAIQPFRCAHFEFEDVIDQIDSVDIVAPRFSNSTQRYSLAKRLAYKTPLHFNPGVPSCPISATYDLFFVICGSPIDLLNLQALGDWRRKCRRAVCLIDELWITQMDRYDRYLRMLGEFDAVFLYYSQSVEPLNKRIGTKSIFLSPAVDTLRFCPYPESLPRSIDVYSVGRRSAVTHHALLQKAAKNGMFYLHDSTSADRVLDAIEHRDIFAKLLKRSRYFIVNPGLVDRVDIRGDQIEIGNRYFEGAAAGSILIGARPDNGEFETNFGWPHALVDLPYDSPDFTAAIDAIERDQQVQDAIRCMNVRQSLLRHDWLYRWEAILEAAGMTPLSKLNDRKNRLGKLADTIAESHSMELADYCNSDDLIRR